MPAVSTWMENRTPSSESGAMSVSPCRAEVTNSVLRSAFPKAQLEGLEGGQGDHPVDAALGREADHPRRAPGGAVHRHPSSSIAEPSGEPGRPSANSWPSPSAGPSAW